MNLTEVRDEPLRQAWSEANQRQLVVRSPAFRDGAGGQTSQGYFVDLSLEPWGKSTRRYGLGLVSRIRAEVEARRGSRNQMSAMQYDDSLFSFVSCAMMDSRKVVTLRHRVRLLHHSFEVAKCSRLSKALVSRLAFQTGGRCVVVARSRLLTRWEGEYAAQSNPLSSRCENKGPNTAHLFWKQSPQLLTSRLRECSWLPPPPQFVVSRHALLLSSLPLSVSPACFCIIRQRHLVGGTQCYS